MPLLEIACDSVTAALTAAQAGADRIELCDNLEHGGITPSAAKIKLLKARLEIPIFVLIRPRKGDFVYNKEELATMLLNIEYAKNFGADGIVSGALNQQNEIHIAQTLELIEAARPLPFTFHRAFDRCASPFEALNDVMQLGCDRILTSGQQPKALQGISLIRALIEQAQGQLQFVIGGGVRAHNLEALSALDGVEAFHSSAKQLIKSTLNLSTYRLLDSEQEELQWYGVDKEEVVKMKDILG